MTIDDLRCVLIVGAGAIGRQIAVSAAGGGFDVVVHDVDRAWMKASHSPRGPFGWLDLVGLDTALEITEYGARATGRAEIHKIADLLKQYVERGLLGVKNGRGLYSYPNPEHQRREFLSNTAR